MDAEISRKEIDEDNLLKCEGAAIIKRIIGQEYEDYVRTKENYIELLQSLHEKRKEKERLLIKIKKQKQEQKFLDILVACQNQLNPLISNNELSNLDRKSIALVSTQIDKTEANINEGQEMKETAVKCLKDISFAIKAQTKEINELSKKNELMKEELHSRSLKHQTDVMKIESLKTEILEIDNNMKSSQDILDEVNEENKKYLSELETVKSKRLEVEKRCSEKSAIKIRITDEVNEKMKLFEIDVSNIDNKIEEIDKILKDDESKICIDNKKSEILLQEINSIKVAITENTMKREKLLDEKNEKLLKYHLLLKNSENERLIGLINAKIIEEEKLNSFLNHSKSELDISKKKITQYECEIKELKEKVEIQIAEKLFIAKQTEELEIEIATNKEQKLKMERQFNDRKQAIAEKRIMSNMLDSDKQRLINELDGLRKKNHDSEIDHRKRCLKLLEVSLDDEISTLSTSAIIKKKEDDKMQIEDEILTIEKDIGSMSSQVQGVTAECNLLTDKISALEEQRSALQQEREREREREREEQRQLTARASTSVDKKDTDDWDVWSDCSQQGAIPIQVAVQRYQQRMHRKLKRKKAD